MREANGNGHFPVLDKPRVPPLGNLPWYPPGTANSLTFLRAPHLLQAFLGVAAPLLTFATLRGSDRELITLRSTWNARGWFPYAHHRNIARLIGRDDDWLERIKTGADAPGWDDRERFLLRAVDELQRDYFLSDELWEEGRQLLSQRQLMDLPFIVGAYTALSMATNTLGIPFDGWGQKQPS